jgi:hypothetical protein
VSEYMSDPVLGMNPSPWRKLDVMTKNLNWSHSKDVNSDDKNDSLR